MAVEVQHLARERIVAVHHHITLVVAVFLIPEAEVFALEIEECLQVKTARTFNVKPNDTVLRTRKYILAEGTLLCGSFQTHQGIVDVRIGSRVNIKGVNQMHDIVYPVIHFFTVSVVGVKVQQGFQEGCRGVPVADEGIALQCSHLIKRVDIDNVLVAVEKAGEVLVELTLTASVFLGVVGLDGIPGHLGTPEEAVPAVIEEGFSIVVPAGVHQSFGTVAITITCQIGDVLHIALRSRNHVAAMAQRRRHPEGRTVFLEGLDKVVVAV